MILGLENNFDTKAFNTRKTMLDPFGNFEEKLGPLPFFMEKSGCFSPNLSSAQLGERYSMVHACLRKVGDPSGRSYKQAKIIPSFENCFLAIEMLKDMLLSFIEIWLKPA